MDAMLLQSKKKPNSGWRRVALKKNRKYHAHNIDIIIFYTATLAVLIFHIKHKHGSQATDVRQ